MAPSVHQVAQIFEDPEPQQRGRRANHNRGPSVGDVLRGRRKDNCSPTKSQTRSSRETASSASPLGERHINSPPQPKRVATKRDDEPAHPAGPRNHKKTGSSVSLKGIILGKEKSACNGSVSSDEGRTIDSKLKKVKSAGNLSGLLKRRSKKDLREEDNNSNNNNNNNNQENCPPKTTPVESPTSIWAQFATQPLEAADGTMIYPMSKRRTVEEEIKLYTPKDYSEFRPAEQRNFYGYALATPSMLDYQPPQRPFLEHKSSRSSIFTENIDDDVEDGFKRPKSRDQPTSRPVSSSKPQAHLDAQAQPGNSLQADPKAKLGSRVFEAIQTFNMRARKGARSVPETPTAATSPLSPQELDSAFEKVLDSLNIPLNMRDNMRNLKPDVKAGLMKGERIGSGSSTALALTDSQEASSAARNSHRKENERPKSEGEGAKEAKDGRRSRSRSRPRSRILTLTRREEDSPPKQDRPSSSLRSRSKSRNKSADLTGSRPTLAKAMASTASLASLNPAESATTPGDFIHYLREVQKPALVEVSKLHKLRILLRNESISWTDHFVSKGGMDELVQLYYRISKIEWREEHEDNLLHEALLCLKGLCTTSLALQRLQQVEHEFFPVLLHMLFDPERKGPSEFNTRGVIISLLFAHLSADVGSNQELVYARAQTILGFLRDPAPEDGKQPLDFVSQMHTPRPYRVWCKEVVNVTKEVFWIFLHHLNVIPIVEVDESVGYCQAHFPPPRPPHPAAPYVGGVEWEATQYLATHLDLLNGLIACLPTAKDRNSLREELKQSGFEKVMGGSLRTCKEKFYSGVHEGLKCWVAAAKTDEWPVEDVRAGPPRETASPKKSPVKKTTDEPPQLALNVGAGRGQATTVDDGWI
ncbi:uncharacterized protein A1O5_05806 [Cladophialophora psammophila CBS 110553]|uniref:Formin GTPase-binding domain-containing protein n=1 Tax=Cladophialophora psammophila CBS 110553 TaxID=1182543 RepID=W9X1K6_9EURO|nr:uncharacterized protein A1O5_05806 [Cladophialophora psammophila CBS 110553]EXJ70816.1 hypothetical protein A1O5_05806 [Cladophialophora psammophila CBS 110553]